MPLPATYTTGTVTVAAGSASVTGTGTNWLTSGVRNGDLLAARGLSVSILSVESATALTLVEPWPGPALTDAGYEIRFTHDTGRVLVAARTVLESIEAGGAAKHNYAALRAPLATDDISQGYTAGSRWLWNGREWVATSTAADAAVWQELEGSVVTSLPWSAITSKPASYLPSEHWHSIAEITDLSAILAGKADTADVASGVRYDAAQTLTVEQQRRASQNIGVGDPETDFAAIYTTALENGTGTSPATVAPSVITQATISGTGTVGQTLTVSVGSASGTPAPTSMVQWLRGGTSISGATGTSYTTVSADGGTTLTARVTWTNTAGSAVSSPTIAVTTATAAPAVTANPTITGSSTVGSILTASNGTASGNPAPTAARQWRSNGFAITGATGATFDTTGRAGQAIDVRVTWTNSAGSAQGTSNTINVTAPAPAGTIAALSADDAWAAPGTLGFASPDTDFDWYDGITAKAQRQQALWANMSRSDLRSNNSLGHYDPIINAVLAADQWMIGLIMGGSVVGGGDIQRLDTSAKRTAFIDWAVACVNRWGAPGTGQIETWQILNELNLNTKATPEDYALLMPALYDAMKAADPDCFIITNGLSSVVDTAGSNISTYDWTDRFMTALPSGRRGDCFDAWAQQPYTAYVTPETAGDWQAWNQMQINYNLMVNTYGVDKPVWITEYGDPTAPAGGYAVITEAEQAENLEMAFYRAARTPWHGPVLIYSERDRPIDNGISDDSSSETFFGVNRRNGTPKPSATMFQALAQRDYNRQMARPTSGTRTIWAGRYFTAGRANFKLTGTTYAITALSGVSINASTGIISITSGATLGTITITATLDGTSATNTLQIVAA